MAGRLISQGKEARAPGSGPRSVAPVERAPSASRRAASLVPAVRRVIGGRSSGGLPVTVRRLIGSSR